MVHRKAVAAAVVVAAGVWNGVLNGVWAGGAGPRGAEPSGEPPWVGAMTEVHGRFRGTPGTLAHFGDSITVTQAYWAPLRHEPKGLGKELAADLVLVKEHVRPECWSGWKGPEYGSDGGKTARWAEENVAGWLKRLNPEAVVVLFGTNDLPGVPVQEYEERLGRMVDRCLANGTVVLLTTPPPRSGLAERSKEYAVAVRRVALSRRVPLADYQAEVLKRRPDDWDGSLPKFRGGAGSEYEVDTLVARDGVHPSNPRAHQDYGEESLARNGYVLRNAVTLRAYADVVRRVLKPVATGPRGGP